MERVNRITIAPVDDRTPTRIKLMRTNTVLATITASSIGVPVYAEVRSKCGKNKYYELMRDRTMRLLRDGKIEGYYWDDTASEGGTKFTISTMVAAGEEMIINTLMGLGVCQSAKVSNPRPAVKDAYKDGTINNAHVHYSVEFDSTHLASIKIDVKSGQMCKPRTYLVGGRDYPLTQFGLQKLLEGRLDSVEQKATT